jgi:radical SAM protein with 4Fe4S-binding SPASM domain
MEILVDDKLAYTVRHNDVIIRYDKMYNFFDSFRLSDGFSITSDLQHPAIDLVSIKAKMSTKEGAQELITAMYMEDPVWFTKHEPFMRSMPSLIDCGIMSSCAAAKAFTCFEECYQKCSTGYEEDITLENYKKIIDEVKGHVFSCALGGAGNVHDHKDFESILKYSKANYVIPNYTTSGYSLTDEHVKVTKENCGAVAVSWNRNPLWRDRAIRMFLKAGVKTNIHYVVSNDSIDEAITRLENDDFPKGIYAVIFLMYKPVGLGTLKNVLSLEDPKVIKFFQLIDTAKTSFSRGLDACSVPAIINTAKNIDMHSVTACDAARMSCYIDANMNMMPCSFDNQDKKFAVNISNSSVLEAWNSSLFKKYRSYMCYSCPDCKDQTSCFGGCILCKSITACNRKERTTV